jgi:hypothetical protein
MVPFNQVVAFFVPCIVVVAVVPSETHRRIIDSTSFHGLGNVCTKRDSQSDKEVVFEHKADFDCQILYSSHRDIHVLSVVTCKVDVAYTSYTTSDSIGGIMKPSDQQAPKLQLQRRCRQSRR